MIFMKPSQYNRNESGNILFLILLAVILFAALSYAVTGSMNGGSKSASPEKAKTLAAQLLNYGGLVENTINRMRLTGGVPEYGLDLNDDTGPSTSAANATCTNADCRLYKSTAGDGQIASLKFGEEFIDPAFRAGYPSHGGGSGAETLFQNINVLNVGTAWPDVVMVIRGMKPEICDAVNQQLWGSATHPPESYNATTGDCASLFNYSGTMTVLPKDQCAIFGDYSAFFKGKSAGCIGRDDGSVTMPKYGGDFYYVVMAR